MIKCAKGMELEELPKPDKCSRKRNVRGQERKYVRRTSTKKIQGAHLTNSGFSSRTKIRTKQKWQQDGSLG